MTNIISAVVAALILTEGGSQPGKHGEVGCLQITPVLVEDLNRIAGRRVWRLSQRANPQAAKAMAQEWLLYWAARQGWTTADQLAWAWNAGPDLQPEARDYRRRFQANFERTK